MNYNKLFEDRDIIDWSKITLVMDNDCGYFSCTDCGLSDDEREKIERALEDRYGKPEGYRDIVFILNAAGVKCEWC